MRQQSNTSQQHQQSQQLSSSSSSLSVVKTRRNKLSFVCQNCRRSKTKCDKLKPSCSRCLRNHYICVYDVESQIKPKSRSKDSRLQQLEREIEYWKSKVEGLYLLTDSVNGDPMISFYHSFPMLLIEGTAKHDINPLSTLSFMGKDLYLFLFWSSTSTESLTGAVATKQRIEQIVKSCIDQWSEISTFMSRLFPQSLPDSVSTNDQAITSETAKKSLSDPYSIDELELLCIQNHYFQDSFNCKSEYPAFLIEMREYFERYLPSSLGLLRRYLNHFYQEIYPMCPFLDIEMFESTINEVIKPVSPENDTIKIDFGLTKVRLKIVHLCLLICILGLTLTSIEVSFSADPANKSPELQRNISELHNIDLFLSVTKLMKYTIGLLSLIHWVDEFTLLTHLYRYTYLLITPELNCSPSSSSTWSFKNDAVAIDSLSFPLSWYANLIGLQIDNYPDDNELKYLNPSLLKLRRKLWLGVSIFTIYDRKTRGRLTKYFNASRQISESEDLKITNILKKDYRDSDPLEFTIQMSFYEKFKAYLIDANIILINLNSCSLKCNINKTFPNSSINKSYLRLSNLENGLNSTREAASSITLKAISDPSLNISEKLYYPQQSLSHISVNITQTLNTHLFQAKMSLLFTCVITSSSLFLYFEHQLKCKTNDPSIPHTALKQHYATYFKKSTHDVLQATSCLLDYLNGKIDLLTGSHFIVFHIVENFVTKCFQVLFGIILRLHHAEKALSDQLSNGVDNLRSITDKLQIIEHLKHSSQQVMKTLHQVISNKLRWKLYTCFKRLIAFDLVMDVLNENKLMDLVEAKNIDRLAHWSLDTNLNEMDDIILVITSDYKYLKELEQIITDFKE